MIFLIQESLHKKAVFAFLHLDSVVLALCLSVGRLNSLAVGGSQFCGVGQ